MATHSLDAKSDEIKFQILSADESADGVCIRDEKLDRSHLSNEPLSEELILETHNILTHVIDGLGGDKSETYSGIYRKRGRSS